MNVLLVYPITPPNFDIFGIQQGLAMLSAVLKERGHDVKLYSHYRYVEREIDDVIQGFQPGLAAFYVAHPQRDLARRMAARMSRRHGLPVVFGGVWPTTRSEEAIRCPDILGIGLGEGEVSLPRLVEALETGEDHTGIAGFWFRHEGEVIRNPGAPYVQDLDALPFPDRTIFQDQPHMNALPYLEFIGQRGCPIGCTNCFHHAWRRNLFGHEGYVRFKSPRRLVDEMKDALERFPLKQAEPCIGFHDPTFTLKRSWALEVCALMEEEIGVPWWCNTRASSMDEELADAMKAAGCFEVHIGIESGDPWIRNEILAKKVDDEQLIAAFQMLKERGMMTFGFNMLGLPYETEESIKRTVELNRKLLPDTVFCSVFNPFPGTDLYDLVVDKGWLSDREVTSYFEHTSVLDQPSVDARTVAHYHKFFRLMVRHPRVAEALRPLDRIPFPVNGHDTLYDQLDAVFGQSARWRKEVIKLMPQSTKDRIKRALHW